MTESSILTPIPVVSSPSTKKKMTRVVKDKKRAMTVHPKTTIKGLQDKNGTSLSTNKKNLGTSTNSKVDSVKPEPFVGKFLKTSVVNKTATQTKGSGVSGPFKLGVADVKSKKTKTSVSSKIKKPVEKKRKSLSGELTVKNDKTTNLLPVVKSKKTSSAIPKKTVAVDKLKILSEKSTKVIKKTVALKKKT